MRFKAAINGCMALKKYSEPPANVHKQFIFTKRQIFFSKHHTSKEYFVQIPPTCGFGNGTFYTYEKTENREGKTVYKITVGNNDRCIATLRMNWFNRLKCAYIHKEAAKTKGEKKDIWLLKAFVTFILSILAYIIGRTIMK